MPAWNGSTNSTSWWGDTGSSSVDVQSTTQSDNTTPLGRGIPKGIGTFGTKGEIIVDPDTVGKIRYKNGRFLVNLVLNFLDSDLGGAATLLWLKANDEFIFRAQEPKRALGSPMRVYGGDQTTADPLITQYLAAEYRTCWPGMGYIVLEDLDITDFSDTGSTIPVITAGWSTDATTVAATETDAVLTFGEYAEPVDSNGYGIDWQRGMYFQILWFDYNQPSPYFTISAISTVDGVEKWRVNITSPLIEITYIAGMTVLPGTDYAIAAGYMMTGGSELGGFMLINTRTGLVVDIIEAVDDGTGNYYEAPVGGSIFKPVMIRSDTETVFMALTEVEFFGPTPVKNNLSFCVKIDVTNESITLVNDPVNNPVRAITTAGINWTYFVLAEAAYVYNGGAVFYAKESSVNTILKVVVSETGVVSCVDVFAPPSGTIGSIVFDSVNAAIVYTTSTQIISIDAVTFAENYSVTPSTPTSLSTADAELRPGYAMGYRSSGNLRQLVNLSDGSMNALVGFDSGPYSQYQGVAVYSDFSLLYPIFPYLIRFGDLTPNTVDAVDILTALMTYKGRYSSGDLTFSGFVGNECYGYYVGSDTTIDECVRDVCDTLGVREYHDAGKVHFVMPERDGSFAVDRALTSHDIPTERIRQEIADQDAAIKDCHLSYLDLDADFAPVTQSYQRPTGVYETTASSRVERPSTNLVMTAPQAVKQAWRMTYESEYDRVKYTLPLAPRAFEIVPSDNVSFTFGSRTIVGQVRASQVASNLSQIVTVSQALQGSENTLLGSGLITPAITTVIPAQLVVLDTALLSLSDDTAGASLRAYAAFIGVGPGDLSTSIAYRSALGTDYLSFGSVNGVSPISGTISGTITRTASNEFETDFGASLAISVASGDPSTMASTDEAGRYSRVNYAVIGGPGRWVIISYGTVSVSGQVATLGEIIWGIQGSWAYLSQLAAGDMFVNLEQDEVLKFTNPTIDATVYYKGGYAGLFVSQMPTQAKVVNGEAEKPFAAVDLAYSDVSSTRTITWEFLERLSIMPPLYDSQSFGYSETSLAFEIDLLNGSTVLTTLTATAATVDYDTGTYTATGANVYQMGRGGTLRGHAANITF